MESTAPDPKPGLPGWAKILIGIAIFLMVSSFLLIGACTYLVNQFETKNIDPVVVKKIANSIVTLDDPLPPGFKWVVGLDIFSMKMAAVNHAPDNLELILTSLPGGKNSSTLEDNISSSQVNPALANATGTQSKFDAKVKGSITVANKQFLYALGVVKDRDGKEVPSLMGFFSPNEDGKVIMLVGVQGEAVLPKEHQAPSAVDQKDTAKNADTKKGGAAEIASSTENAKEADKNVDAGGADDALVKTYNMAATKQFLQAIKKI